MSQPPNNFKDRAAHGRGSLLWLLLSLAANFFLVLFLYLSITGRDTVPKVIPVPETATLIKTNVVVRHENFTWDQAESTNYGVYIRNLRAIGCPEQTIRDIIVNELDRLYLHRKFTEVVDPGYQWWRSEPEPAAVQAASARMAEIEADRRRVLTELLGPGWDSRTDEEIAGRGGISLTGPLLGDLSPATKAATYAVAARGQLKIEAYQEDQRNAGRAADPVEMVRLREEPLAALLPVLDPAAYQEYLLRYSPGAQQLRLHLRPVQLTQDQFRELFNAEYSLNSQPAFYYAGTDPALIEQRDQLRSQSEAVLKSTLGATLYTSLQLAQDPTYLQSRSAAGQLGLPDAAVTPIYEVNLAAQTELNRIRLDPNMSAEDKISAISQTQVEQQQSLEQLLGPELFQRWLKNNTNSY